MVVMTKMQKLVLLMSFWFSPWGAGKSEEWEWLTGDKPYDEDTLFTMIAFVINGIDDKFIKWEALEGFTKQMNEATGIVVAEVATPPAHEDETPVDPPAPAVAATPRKRKPKKEA